MSGMKDYTTELEISATSEGVLDADRLAGYCSVIRDNPGLKKIFIRTDAFNTDDAREVLSALTECKNLESIKLWNVADTAAVASFVAAGGALPSLREFEAYQTPLTDTDAVTIAKTFRDHPSLQRISVKKTEMTSVGMLALIDILPTLKHLVKAEVSENFDGIDAVEDAMDVLLNNPNIQLAAPLSVTLDQQCMQNQTDHSGLISAVFNAHKDGKAFDPELFVRYERVRHAIAWEKSENGDWFRQAFDALDAAMIPPELPPKLTPEWLSTPDADGYAPLHYPAIWKQLPVIAAQMDADGTPLRKAHFGEKAALLIPGIACHHLPEIVAMLTQSGEVLTLDEVKQGDGLSPLGQTLAQSPQIAQLFQEDYWLGQPNNSARALFDALPPNAQAQIDNIHQLTATLSRANRAISRGSQPS